MSVNKNVIANHLGQGWTGLMGLAFIPWYIRYLGMEAYGLIGIFALLQAWLTLLDMGMTPALNREMARFAAGAHTPQSIRDLLRSLEIIALSVATLAGLLIWATSEWLTAYWLKVEELPIETVSHAITIMGAVASLRLVEGVYRGAILGLQRQVFFNALNAFLATARAGGAVLILAWFSPTIDAYFIWQGIVSVISVCVLAVATHSRLPAAPEPSRFSRKALYEIRHFIAGLMATTFLALLLTQVDKVLLSRLLSLEHFGYYTLAATVATAITLLITPITQAFYPRFTELIAGNETVALARSYHHAAQMVTVLAVPAAFMLMFFGSDLLVLWTGNPELSQRTAPLLALLAFGTLLNGLMYIPYMLQLAHGWSSFAAKTNLVAVTLLVPAIIWATPRYGAIGVAWAWVLLNAGYILVAVHFMHRRLLPKEKWNWYTNDVFLPMLTVALLGGFLWFVRPMAHGRTLELLWLISVGFALVSAAICAIPELRSSAATIITTRIKRKT